MEEKDLLDKEIWLENRIQESNQEVEEKLTQKIEELEYKKTIEDLYSQIEKLNKAVEQVDYYRNRALESLQEDVDLKINDIKIVQDNLLEKKITDLIDNEKQKQQTSMDGLKKNAQKQMKKYAEQVKKIEEENNERVDAVIAYLNSKVEDSIDSIGKGTNGINSIEDLLAEKVEKAKNEILNEMKLYVERRILGLRYALTLEGMNKDLNMLKSKLARIEKNNKK